MKTFRYRGHWENVEHNEFCSEMIGERNGVGQSMQRSLREIGGKQKGVNGLRFFDQGIFRRTRTHGIYKTISMTKDLFGYGTEEHLPQRTSGVSAQDHHVHLLFADEKLQLFPDIAFADD